MTFITINPGIDTGFSTKLNSNFNTTAYNMTVLYKKYTSDYIDAGDFTAWLSNAVAVSLDNSATTILRTIDSGSNWVSKTTGLDADSVLYVNPNDCNYMIVFGSAYNGVAKYSDDAGDTWTTVVAPTDADQNYIAYSITDSGRIYALYDDGGNIEIGYTDDNSAWSVCAVDPSAEGTSVAMQIASPKDSVIVYFATFTDHWAGYSLDNGATWEEDELISGGSDIGILHALYIDSDNYLIDICFDESSTGNGLHKIVWQGNVISEDIQVWGYEYSATSEQLRNRTLLKFTTTEFTYQQLFEDSTWNDNTFTRQYLQIIYSYRSDVSTENPLIMPLGSVGFIDTRYLGVGLSSFSRVQGNEDGLSFLSTANNAYNSILYNRWGEE